MPFKFENLEAWQLAQDYIEMLYAIAGKLPPSEEHNLNSQLRRAAVSIGLNIAEGSTGQSNPQQARYVTIAIGSLQETVACIHIIRRLGLVDDQGLLDQAYRQAEKVVSKLFNLRKGVAGPRKVADEGVEYEV